MSLVSRGLVDSTLITRGYGSSVIIVVTPDAPRMGANTGRAFGDKSIIQTKKVTFKGKSDSVRAEVLLLNPADLGQLDAILLSLEIEDYEVHLVGDVEITD